MGMKRKILKLLKTRFFWLNILGAIVLLVLMFIGVMFYLKSFTRHGETLTVPNFIGLQIEEVENICMEKGLNYVILDSVYHDYFDKGSVVEQHPLPDSKVKKERKIYLTTNCYGEEMVVMPDFVGYTVRQAQALAGTYGLIIGNLIYVPDIAVNVVIRQLYKEEAVYAGTEIRRGSTIDFLVGVGLSDSKTIVPDLTGLTYREAGDRLLREYLNLGAVQYDTTVVTKNDSMSSKVYKQYPKRDTINPVNLGYNIDIWLTTDMSLIDERDIEETETE